MKAPGFDYRAPRRLAEATAILQDAGPDGRVLAGGQSLMPMMNMRIVAPQILVDINRIEDLARLEVDGGTLRVGALVRHVDILNSPLVAAGWPLMREATTYVAHPAIRNRGTTCGSVAHNDPAAEHPSVLLTLGGSVVIASAGGRREVQAHDFLQGIMTTALEPGEMVVELRYPAARPGTGWAFVEFARRLGDFALGGAAALLTMRHGVCEEARLTLVGMGEGPVRVLAAEELLTGQRIDAAGARDLFAAAARLAMGSVEPTEDVHAGSGYRRHLAGVMTRRALNTALARSRGEHHA
ncbi:xanthine dehydrogenase family protein subunit M [Xanthobacter sp. KR7-225]|uniref:FAD binding domain-containing protein n=1 Tax=Xanthobacter sp. KR7-225 TaxID=3156613 RepID=UPI0032B31766